jgi:hypothetical protein
VQGVAATAETALLECTFKAPADAVAVGLFLFLINNAGESVPIWFDNAILGCLAPTRRLK